VNQAAAFSPARKLFRSVPEAAVGSESFWRMISVAAAVRG
jgi:hypothetical protein